MKTASYTNTNAVHLNLPRVLMSLFLLPLSPSLVFSYPALYIFTDPDHYPFTHRDLLLSPHIPPSLYLHPPPLTPPPPPPVLDINVVSFYAYVSTIHQHTLIYNATLCSALIYLPLHSKICQRHIYHVIH